MAHTKTNIKSSAMALKVPMIGIIDVIGTVTGTSSTGVVASQTGKGFTAAYSGANGIYTITLDNAPKSIQNVQCTLLSANTGPKVASIQSCVAATGVITVKIWDCATPTYALILDTDTLHFRAAVSYQNLIPANNV